MKLTTILGIVLIAVGALGLAYGGISFTTQEEVVDVGPIEASVEEKETIPLPPVAGGIAVLAGVGLLLVGRKNS
jgi:hypothetical protein